MNKRTQWSAAKRVPKYTPYWTVGTVSTPCIKPYFVLERNDAYDDAKFAEGNYYRTREHAEKAVKEILAAEEAQRRREREMAKWERNRIAREAEERRRQKELEALRRKEWERARRMPSLLVTLPKAAARLGYPHVSVVWWSHQPGFPGFVSLNRMGHRLWRLTDVEAWLRDHPRRRCKPRKPKGK